MCKTDAGEEFSAISVQFSVGRWKGDAMGMMATRNRVNFAHFSPEMWVVCADEFIGGEIWHVCDADVWAF